MIEMIVKISIVLEIIFIVKINGDVRHPEKMCQPTESYASGGSLNDMIGQLFPCNVEAEPSLSNGESDSLDSRDNNQQYQQDPRFDQHRSREISQSVLDLSQNLIQNILKERPTKKYEVLSPISIASAIHLALLGSHGITFNELMDLMDYNTKDFSQYPQKIHEEFGLILEDLVNNTLDPTRKRFDVPWRTQASKHYVRRSMRFQNSQPDYQEHKISVANGIFIQNDFTIRDEFREVVQKIYKSDIENLDFRGNPKLSTQFLNNWVNEKTNGKIKEIIPGSINPATRVILLNALYFKADWQEPFFDGATGLKKFYPYGKDNDYSIMVDLMAHGGEFPHYYDPDTNCEILGFPYKQNASTMYVILPRNSSANKLIEMQALLTADKIERMIDSMVLKTAVILFPKMHLTGGYHLKPYLMDLGLHTLFQQQASDLSVLSDGSYRTNHPQSASLSPSNQLIFARVAEDKNRTRRDVTNKVDSNKYSPAYGKKKSKLHRSKRQSLSPLDSLDLIRNKKHLLNPQLFAEEIIHKVDLTVNEKGTEGGAVTAIALNRSGTKVVFRCDTPFMFIIRHDRTRIPLFYGVVFEPQN